MYISRFGFQLVLTAVAIIMYVCGLQLVPRSSAVMSAARTRYPNIPPPSLPTLTSNTSDTSDTSTSATPTRTTSLPMGLMKKSSNSTMISSNSTMISSNSTMISSNSTLISSKPTRTSSKSTMDSELHPALRRRLLQRPRTRPVSTIADSYASQSKMYGGSSWSYLYSVQHGRYLATTRHQRRHQRSRHHMAATKKSTSPLSANSVRQSIHSLIRIETAGVNNAMQVHVRLFSEDLQKYICFGRSGKLRLLKHPERFETPRQAVHRKFPIVCRFIEQPSMDSPGSLQYMAVESTRRFRRKHRRPGRRRLLSFCGRRRQPNLRRRRRDAGQCHAVIKVIAGDLATASLPMKPTHRRRLLQRRLRRT